MKFNSRIAFGAIAAATLLVTTPVGSQGKRVIDMKAPVMNEKEIKVECVHTIPHMMLRNKTKETATFSINTAAEMTGTNCKLTGVGQYTVEPGQRCMLKFNPADMGKAVTQVSAETATTRYIFRGEWPVYVCCRGKFNDKLITAGDLWIPESKEALKTGTFYRGYAVTILPDRIDNHNREKDSLSPFTVEGNFSNRKFERGPCDDPKGQ